MLLEAAFSFCHKKKITGQAQKCRSWNLDIKKKVTFLLFRVKEVVDVVFEFTF